MMKIGTKKIKIKIIKIINNQSRIIQKKISKELKWKKKYFQIK